MITTKQIEKLTKARKLWDEGQDLYAKSIKYSDEKRWKSEDKAEKLQEEAMDLYKATIVKLISEAL